MTQIIDRYQWEDAVLTAESLDLIKSGAVHVCLRLAMAITWRPDKKRAGQPSALYWKNEDALKKVGSSQATYYRYRKELFDAGLFVEIKGNLVPQIPDFSQIENTNESIPVSDSHIENANSQIENNDSQIENNDSQSEYPYTVDTYTVDLSTGNPCTVIAEAIETQHIGSSYPANAGAIPKITSNNVLTTLQTDYSGVLTSSSLSPSSSAFPVENNADSQIENLPYWEKEKLAKRAMRERMGF